MSAVHPLRPNTPRAYPDEGIPTYDARELVGDGVQVRIVLDDQTYWLRITRAGKLILTK